MAGIWERESVHMEGTNEHARADSRERFVIIGSRYEQYGKRVCSYQSRDRDPNKIIDALW
jgi:hypothetical protein